MSFAGEPPLFEHYRSCTTGRALFESLKEQLVDETLAKQECALIMQYFDRAVRSEFQAMQAKDQQDDDADDDDDVDMGGETNANSARKRGAKSKGKGKASKTKKKRQVFDTKISGELNRRQALSGVANIFVKHMRIEPTSRTSQVADDVEAEWCKFVAMDAKPLQAKKRGRRRG